jgi:hypothetical protein
VDQLPGRCQPAEIDQERAIVRATVVAPESAIDQALGIGRETAPVTGPAIDLVIDQATCPQIARVLAIVRALETDLVSAKDQLPAIDPTESKIAASVNSIAKIVATKSKTSSATIIRAGTSGETIRTGRHGDSMRPTAGQRGER